MFTAAAQVAAVERRVTAYSEAGQGTDSSQPSFRVSLGRRRAPHEGPDCATSPSGST